MNPTLENWLRQPTTMLGLAMIACAAGMAVLGLIPAAAFACVLVPALGLVGVSDRTAFASDAEILAVDAVTSATTGAIATNLPRLIKEAMAMAADVKPAAPVAATLSAPAAALAAVAPTILALVLGCSLLTACATTSGPTGVLSPANITEARSVVTGLFKAYGDIKADFPTLVPAATDAQIASALNDAATAVNALSTLAASNANAANLTAISNDTTAVLNTLAAELPGTVPPEIVLALQAAQVLVPDLIALAGQPAAMPTGAAVTLPDRFKAPGMSKEAALGVLAGK